MSPPGKEKPRLGGTGLTELTTPGCYHSLDLLQVGCCRGWQREAVRLFGEYWRTGNLKHLCAFVRHVVAMRAYEARAMQ